MAVRPTVTGLYGLAYDTSLFKSRPGDTQPVGLYGLGYDTSVYKGVSENGGIVDKVLGVGKRKNVIVFVLIGIVLVFVFFLKK